MKIDLPQYSDIDLDVDAWKTLSIVYSAQEHLHLERVPQQMVLSIKLLDSINSLTEETINSTERLLYDHIAILKSKQLLLEDRGLYVTTSHKTLMEKLQELFDFDFPLLSLTMYIFYKIVSKQSQPRVAVFSNFDDRLTSHYKSLGYIEKGLFLKITLNGHVFTGTIKLGEELAEVYSHILNIKENLSRIGFDILALEKLPMYKIVMFPLFTIGSEIIRSIGKDLGKKYIAEQKENIPNLLKKWFTDYLAARHEIAKQIPQMTLVDPFSIKTLHVLVIASKELDRMLIRNYLSIDDDKVDVRILDEIPKDEEINKLPDLPNVGYLLHETRRFGQTLIENLGHPYLEALKEIGRSIEEFNRISKISLYDADNLTIEQIKDWTIQEINMTRYLIKRLDIRDPAWKIWLLPLSVYIVYSLDQPKENERRSGDIISSFYISEQDTAVVKKVDEIKPQFEILSYFPELKGKSGLLWESHSDLLFYMAERIGEDWRSYF